MAKPPLNPNVTRPRIEPPLRPIVKPPRRPVVKPPQRPQVPTTQSERMKTISGILEHETDMLSAKLRWAMAGSGSDFTLPQKEIAFKGTGTGGGGVDHLGHIEGLGKMTIAARPTTRTVLATEFFSDKAIEAARKKICGDKPNCKVDVKIEVHE